MRDESGVGADDIIVEIGPGQGVLTEVLLVFAAKVIAIEKDPDLVVFLKEKFSYAIENGRLDLIEGDVLDFDPELLSFYEMHYKVVANIPYYITGLIIKKFLTASHQPECMVLLVQKEVATRIVARDGKESILSLSVKAYGTPKLVMTVPARDFAPAPKVDSAILSITNISHDRLDPEQEARFFRIIKKGFSQKRKQLAGTVPPLIPKESLIAFFREQKIPVTARPEELSLEDWIRLID